MKRAPTLWNLRGLYNYLDSGPRMEDPKTGKWFPARPFGFFSLRNRIKLAWGVFQGRYDALKWPASCR